MIEMDGPGFHYVWWAAALGAVSAVSLPLGAAAGLRFRPGLRVTGAMAGFGAGALIAALTLELIAPTVDALSAMDGTGAGHGGGSPEVALLGLVAGALVGGVLFLVLDHLVSLGGGYLRRISTTIAYATRRRDEATREILKDLCTVSVLRLLPAEQVGLMVRDVRPRAFDDGEYLFQQGDDADALYFIRAGVLALEREGEVVEKVGVGKTVGETALVSGAPRLVSARACGPVETLALDRADVERWRATCPEFDANLHAISEERLENIGEAAAARVRAAEQWARDAIGALRQGAMIPTPAELRAAGAEHGGMGFAVWLGSLIDGIPESLVIGSGLLALITERMVASEPVSFASVLPVTLIAGLFLSNFPEAMSSSVSMQVQGWSSRKILGLWVSQMVMISIGAGAGYALGGELSHATLIVIEGLAAGAMLTVIVSTMIPEAVHLGGHAVVGLSTLSGFLAAVLFKLLE